MLNGLLFELSKAVGRLTDERWVDFKIFKILYQSITNEHSLVQQTGQFRQQAPLL